MTEISLKVNGKNINTTANISLPNLLAELGFNPRLIAIEYNGEILHRQFWDNTQLQSGDRLEVVTIVGGG
jgi:sulfur carrier protein